jgi:hypothetical protein
VQQEPIAPTPQHLAQLAEALPALEALAPFDARLAGTLATAAIGAHDAIVLHVCSEHPDHVHRYLQEAGIPVRCIETLLHRPRSPATRLPGVSFYAGDREFRVWIFDEGSWRQRLRIGAEAAPSRRLTAKALRALIAAAQPRSDSGT